MNVLDGIMARKRAEAASLARWESALRDQAADAPGPRSLAGALRRDGEVSVLAEVKRKSPSAGWIREGADAAGTAAVYEAGGAAGVSVLTDEEGFGGTLDDLRAVRGAVSVPVLCKDFIVAAAQVWEARSAGADAVLLIVAVLDGEELVELLAAVSEAGMEALVEVHAADELERALSAGASLIGVNNRDLSTFEVDLSVAERLAADVPDEVVLVGESGIRGPEDVERLGAAGVDAVLVGESLMRAADALTATEALTGRRKAGRRP